MSNQKPSGTTSTRIEKGIQGIIKNIYSQKQAVNWSNYWKLKISTNESPHCDLAGYTPWSCPHISFSLASKYPPSEPFLVHLSISTSTVLRATGLVPCFFFWQSSHRNGQPQSLNLDMLSFQLYHEPWTVYNTQRNKGKRSSIRHRCTCWMFLGSFFINRLQMKECGDKNTLWDRWWWGWKLTYWKSITPVTNIAQHQVRPDSRV